MLNRRDVVSVHQSAATLHEVAALAGSLRDVTSVRCEGYSTVGGPERRQDRLSAERAAGICALLAQHRTGLSTTSVGYGSRRPVLVGGTSAQRAHNRRVVVVALASRTPKPPAPPAQQAHVPGAPTLSSVTGGVLSATLTFAAPASTGGSTVTGYAWSTDQTTWTPLTTTGSSPYTVQLTSLTPGTATYYVRAVNAVGAGARQCRRAGDRHRAGRPHGSERHVRHRRGSRSWPGSTRAPRTAPRSRATSTASTTARPGRPHRTSPTSAGGQLPLREPRERDVPVPAERDDPDARDQRRRSRRRQRPGSLLLRNLITSTTRGAARCPGWGSNPH